jgi:GT2 family glycosyltransferase
VAPCGKEKSMKKKIFIIILNYKREKDTLECLNSLKKLQNPESEYQIEIVVVDSASSDGSRRIIGNLKSQISNLKVIESKKNLGFAAGNNLGINYALSHEAEYIMILNNDTLVDGALLTNLVSCLQKNPKVAVVSPKIYFAKGYEFHKDRYKESELGKVIWYAGGEIDWKNVYGKNTGVDEVDRRQFDTIKQVDYATGSCSLISVQALKKVGLYDERYFMYFEDTDLSTRLKKVGFDVLYQPKAKLWHKVARSSGIGSELNDYFITRNRMLFGLKYAPLRSKLALIKESAKFLLNGRKWQKIGVRDYYLQRFGIGSWKQ